MNDVNDKRDVKSKRMGWARVLLVASLGLNLAVIGAFVGAHFADRGPRGEESFGRGLLIGPYARAFSKEDRADLRRSFVARAGTLRDLRQQMRASGAEIAAALRATPFDAEAVRAALNTQRDVQIALQDEGQNILIEQLTAMTPQARARFADNLERGLKRGPRR
jgi:uncharacterized membrane protein